MPTVTIPAEIPLWLAVFPFIQALLISAAVHVSIGVYGSFHLVRSLSELTTRNSGVRFSVVHRVESDDDGMRWGVIHLPTSARDMPFAGLCICGLLGPVSVVVMLVAGVIGIYVEPVRRIVIQTVFVRRGGPWVRER